MEARTSAPVRLFGGGVTLENGRIKVSDEAALRSAHMDELVRQAVFSDGQQKDCDVHDGEDPLAARARQYRRAPPLDGGGPHAFGVDHHRLAPIVRRETKLAPSTRISPMTASKMPIAAA